jgi:predicted tellurium resistance membrane protein TerC
MFGAGALMEVLDRYPALVWAGAGLLGWVAGDMIANDPFWTQPGDIDHALLEKGLSILGLVIVIVSAWIVKKLENQAQE